MIILGIETSCDETAIAIIEANKGDNGLEPSFRVLGNALFSQIEIHKQYGGVFPIMAKREHAKNLTPILSRAMEEARNTLTFDARLPLPTAKEDEIKKLLEREDNLSAELIPFLNGIGKPHIDAIAITYGPGLEPALWVGISFAIAIGLAWNIPLIPINHMEGHIVAALLKRDISSLENNETEIVASEIVRFPLLALLVSGGHTELVIADNWLSYTVIGKTRDDAVGEAYDKAARILGLPYPGGPEIARLAEEARIANIQSPLTLPRPMIHSKDFDFSFSGLKTAVLYGVKKLGELSAEQKKGVAREFEEAVTDTLIGKTIKAIEQYAPDTIIIGGGVSANTYLQKKMITAVGTLGAIKLLLPDRNLSTDNAIMIAIAGFINLSHGEKTQDAGIPIRAQGNLKL